jgi:hypothetical protein
MDPQRVVVHTPEDMRRLSNLGHWIEGAFMAATGILALGDAARGDGRTWPAAAAGGGTLLAAGLLAASGHHGGPRRFLQTDRQQRQHVLIGVALTGGALAELAAGDQKPAPLRAVWPSVLAGVGASFLTHQQHGTAEALERSLRFHRTLGATLVAAGLARALELATAWRPLRFAWPSLMLGAAAQLLTYREPEGAYEPPHGPARNRE